MAASGSASGSSSSDASAPPTEPHVPARAAARPPWRRAVAFFATGPDAATRLEPAAARALYRRARWSVFLSVTFGYGLFYVGRVNLAVAKKPLLDAGVLTPAQLGIVESALLVVYAFGRLTNGFLADRSNIRRFMSVALLVSAGLNLALGFNALFVVFVLLWAVNGWAQSVGSAPSVVALTQWFAARERGTRYGIWSMSHAIGEGLTLLGTTALVAALGWRWGFWGPALVCGVTALVLSRTLADRPETYGLPPVWEYAGEEPPPAAQQKAGVGQLQLSVLRSRAVWTLALASACMYVGRYGMDNSGLLFLQAGKGYSLVGAGRILAASPIAQIAGTVGSGLVSDRLFGSRRKVPALVAAALATLGLLGFYLTPAGHPLLHTATVAAYGLGLGALLVFIGGLWAVDLVPRRASGAAMGVVGVFAYLGAAVQSLVTGALLGASERVEAGVTTYGFGGVFAFWVGASVLVFVLAATIPDRAARGPRPQPLATSRPGTTLSET